MNGGLKTERARSERKVKSEQCNLTWIYLKSLECQFLEWNFFFCMKPQAL